MVGTYIYWRDIPTKLWKSIENYVCPAMHGSAETPAEQSFCLIPRQESYSLPFLHPCTDKINTH